MAELRRLLIDNGGQGWNTTSRLVQHLNGGERPECGNAFVRRPEFVGEPQFGPETRLAPRSGPCNDEGNFRHG